MRKEEVMARTKEDHAAYMREYYKTRPEQLEKKRAADREHYRKNRETRLAYVKNYYQENKEQVRERTRVAGKLQRMRLRDEAIARCGGKCRDCGIDNRMVLQFHHRDPSLKKAEALATSTKRFWEEVDKCDLLCANCHLIRHGGENA